MLFLSIIAWGTCTTTWHSPNDDDPHGSFSWTNGAGGRTAYDDDRAYTTLNGDEHEFDEYGFTLGGDIPVTAVIVGFEVRIRGYSEGSVGSVQVGLSWDGGSTVDKQAGTQPWVIGLPQGSSNEAWNSVNIDNPPFIHTFTPAEVCANNFTVWVKANVGGTAIYVDAVQVQVIYYDELVFPWNPNNPSSVSSTTHSAGVWYNASTLPPEGTTATLQWNSATDRPTCDSGIDGYRIYWDASSSTNLGATDGYYVDESGAHTQDFALVNGQRWFHIRSVDNVSNLADSTAHYGPYQYDDTWPTNPSVTSSQATYTWLNSADVEIISSGASDTPSGVDGFETAWTHAATWTHTATKNREESWTGETFTLVDGLWYFHLATVDNAGNWVPTVLYETEGCFYIDTHVPTDPTVTSPTHAEGSVSSNSNVQISVNGATDPQYGESGYENSSGVDGFSVAWDGSAVSPPDAVKDHEDDWTGTTYALADGTWYFHLRTTDNAGNWTSTEDYGPVTIDTTPPNAPIITGIAADNGSSSTDEITNDNTLIISGTAEANSTVEVFRDSVSIGTTPADGSGNWAFDYTGTPLGDGSYSFTATATDAAGLTSALSSALPVLIDTQAPPTPGGRTPADGTYTNDNTPTFSWSEPTDPGGSGVRDYRIQVIDSGLNVDKDSYPSATSYTPSSGSPLDDDAYTWRLYTRDIAGNTGAWGDEWTLVVDTEAPTCTVSVGTATICDGDLVQEVTVDYSEEMTHTANAPTIVFTGTAGTWSSNGNGSWDGNYDQWTESFTITDAGEDVTATVTASGAEDLAGNTQVSNQTTFAIDTLNPTVTNLYLSSSPDTTITDWDVTDVTQDGLYVHFSEPMTNDGSADPVFEFDPVITHTLPNGDNSLWDPASPDTVYGYFTAAQDGNVDVDSVDVDVTGARDEHGNLLVPYSQAGVFDIDTLNPTITSITSITLDGYYGFGSSINVTVSFSEPVTLTGGTLDVTLDTPDDVIGLVAFGPSTSSFTTYTVGAGDNSCDLDAIGVVLNGGTLRDNVGNDAVVGLPATTIADGSNITVDTTIPVISGLDLPDTEQSVDANCEITVSYSAVVTDNCCINTGVGATNITVVVEFVSGAGTAILTALPATILNSGIDQVDVFGSFTVSDLTAGDVVIRVLINGIDCSGNVATEALDTVTIGDSTIPVISGLDLPDTDQSVDEFCSITIPYSAIVTDNCCLDAGSVNVVVEFVDPFNTAVLTAPPAVIVNSGRVPNDTVTVSGSFTVSDLTGDPIHVRVRINGTDCNGNVAIQASDTVVIIDSTIPVIVWNTELPPSPQYVDPMTCTIAFPILATVTDNCCILADNVSVDISVTNATLAHGVTVTQLGEAVVVAGIVTVSSLTGCPAELSIAIDAIDCCGNDAAQLTDLVEIYDNTLPTITIDYLRPADGDGFVNDCCEEIMEYQVTVADNCCVDPDVISVNVEATNAIIRERSHQIVKTPAIWTAGVNSVVVTGTYIVQCVTECPALTEITVTLLSDCCNSPAVTASQSYDTIYDKIEPVPRDDPRQDISMDESAATIDPLVEVRLDEFGVYRLILRESTPVRIDILSNDADNCSCEDCAHPFDLCGDCNECSDCCGTQSIYEIVEHPHHGTVKSEDKTGDCNGGSVIRYAPDRGYLGSDYFTYRTEDACGNVSSVIATVYLQVVPEVWMEDVFVIACQGETVEFTVSAADLFIDPDDPSIIEFVFSIDGGPEHGIIGGSLLDVVYTPASRVTDPRFGVKVPSLDFSEAGAIVLTYTPADGFLGRDQVRIRFEDPFGGVAIAVVDITVGQCVDVAARTVIYVIQGKLLPLVVPLSFASVLDAGMGTVTLISLEDGTLYPDAITAEWSEAINRHILTLNTAGLPLGSYELKIPLGTGEIVTLTIEVGEAK